MTRWQAITLGYTHEGTYRMLPVYFREPDNTVAGKNDFLDYAVWCVGKMDLLWLTLTGQDCFKLYLRPL